MRFGRALVVIGLVAMVCTLVYALWCSLAYKAAFDSAYGAFVTSRGPYDPPVDSYEFLTRGIGYGFTEEEVDAQMQAATDRTGRLYYGGGTPGFQKRYTFVYNPVFVVPIFGTRITLIREWYTVVFDDSGRAIRLERHLFLNADDRTGSTTVDLKAGT